MIKSIGSSYAYSAANSLAFGSRARNMTAKSSNATQDKLADKQMKEESSPKGKFGVSTTAEVSPFDPNWQLKKQQVKNWKSETEGMEFQMMKCVFAPEEEEKMKNMSIEERIPYRRALKERGEYYERPMTPEEVLEFQNAINDIFTDKTEEAPAEEAKKPEAQEAEASAHNEFDEQDKEEETEEQHY